MNKTARRLRHKTELRTEIMEAAREIFAREGYEGFTVRKLAKRIGYSPASIYLHFRSKQELFDCLVEESFERLRKALAGLKNGHGQDPVAALKKGMHTYVTFGLQNPNDYRFAFMLRQPDPEEPYQVHPAFEIMRHMVRRCVEQKRFRQVNVETTSQALWATAHGIASLLIQRPTFPWAPKRELVGQVINNAIDSLMTTPDSAAEQAGGHHG